MQHTLDDRIVDDRLLDDRRDTRRMPQAGGLGVGKLRIGSKMITVEILDQSAGGFLVVADKIPKISPTQSVELINGADRHNLLVCWRRVADGRTRLGLQRLSDEIVWRQDSSWVIWMVVAIILGFGIGYLVAFEDQASLVRRIRAVSGSKVIVNDTIRTSPSNPVAPASLP